MLLFGTNIQSLLCLLCLFHRRDGPPLTITFNNKNLLSKDSMNVLGISFDCKLNWHKQIQLAITKSNKALNAIKLISKHFNKNESKTLLTSNFYSILYYNSEIWHIPSLSVSSKVYILLIGKSPKNMYY